MSITGFDVDLRDYVTAEKWPTLAQASVDQWQARDLENKWGPHAWINFFQIFRTGWTVSETVDAMRPFDVEPKIAKMRKEMLDKHLDALEIALLDGRPSRIQQFALEEFKTMYANEIVQMGGARFYLERDPQPEDRLELVVLRPTQFREWTNFGGSTNHEWLSEISLRVWPA